MRIVYRVNQRIGPPVWYAKTAKGLCMVTCGRKAETFDSFFAEGAWADPLSEAGDPQRSPLLLQVAAGGDREVFHQKDWIQQLLAHETESQHLHHRRRGDAGLPPS